MREMSRRKCVGGAARSHSAAIFAEICEGKENRSVHLELLCLISITKTPVARIPLEPAPVLSAEPERLSTIITPHIGQIYLSDGMNISPIS